MLLKNVFKFRNNISALLLIPIFFLIVLLTTDIVTPVMKNKVPVFYRKEKITNSSSRLSKKCLSMFDIGYDYYETHTKLPKIHKDWNVPSAHDWHRLLAQKKENVQEVADYLPFTKSLISMISTNSQGKLIMRNSTRLKLLEGNLPYIPCSIREYSNQDVFKCFRERNNREKSLWIVFVGDSTMRNMFFYMMNRTQSFTNWIIDGKYKFSEKFLNSYTSDFLTDKRTDAVSTSGLQLTFIRSKFGLFSERNQPANPQDDLKKWLFEMQTKRIPDFLIIEFGSWHFAMGPPPKLDGGLEESHDNLFRAWRKLSEVLKPLSKRMTVIAHVQTVFRNSSMEHNKQLAFKHLLTVDYIYSIISMKSNLEFADQAMANNIRDSNIVLWDSTLPFNVASSLECDMLLKLNRSILAEEEDGRKMKKKLRRLMCFDNIHKTWSTIHDESTMLLNLFCNEFVTDNQTNLCC